MRPFWILPVTKDHTFSGSRPGESAAYVLVEMGADYPV
jgi:hypothetical protein